MSILIGCNSSGLPFFFFLMLYILLLFSYMSFFSPILFKETSRCCPFLLLVGHKQKNSYYFFRLLIWGAYPPGLWLLLCYDTNIENTYFLVLSSKSNNTPVAVSIPSIQFLVYQYHSPIKGTKLLEKVFDCIVRAEKIQNRYGKCSRNRIDEIQFLQLKVQDLGTLSYSRSFQIFVYNHFSPFTVPGIPVHMIKSFILK